MTSETQLNVVHNIDKKRFEIQLDETNVAKITYLIGGGIITFDHTGVPQAYEGRGIAGMLAKTALDYARDNGLKVRPQCPYVATYIKRHAEYQPITIGYEQQ
ncbi:MAG: N-acetyltransferase [Anaerolineae bacterium]|nr:N-acetyltransferase [Anaerolineae bacterium]MBN8617864.1 N-acetyltransferase [Anaerolineae bacterium]